MLRGRLQNRGYTMIEPLEPRRMLSVLPRQGDITGDGLVDISDLRVLARNFGKKVIGWTAGDMNFDGVVDSADLGILARAWRAPVPRVIP